MDEMDDIEPGPVDRAPTPADQLPRLSPRPSHTMAAPTPPMSDIAEPTISVVVDTPPIRKRKGLRLGIAAAIVIVLLAAASFVWKLDDPAPGYSLSAAAAATQNVDGLRFEMDVDVDGTTTSLSGAMDVKARVMQMDLDAGQLNGTASGTKISAFMDLKNLVMYIGGDAIGAPMPAGKTWVRMDLAKLAAKTGQDLSSLTQGSTNDPLSAAGLASKASKTKDLGRETVLDGVKAEHFQFEVNTDEALKAAGTTRDKVIGTTGATLPDVVAYDAWVDADNHIRQITFDMAVADQKLHFAARYTEINPTLDIALPTADKSVDIFDITGA